MITTADQLIQALTASTVQRVPFYRVSVTTEGAGFFHSFWKVGGFPGAASANPATGVGANPDRTTAGALPLTNPSGGNKLYLAQMGVVTGVIGTVRLYDRLWHNSGLSGTSVVSQSVNSTAWSRGDTTGAGVELWVEVYTAFGSTGATLTVTYTNQAGTGSRTGTLVHPANAPTVGQMIPVQLQAGDTGVRSVQSVIWSGTTSTAGDFGLTLVRPLVELPIAGAGVGMTKDAFSLGLPEISSDACLALMLACSAGTSGLAVGTATLCEG